MILHLNRVNQKKLRPYIQMKKQFRKMLLTADIQMKPHLEQYIVFVQSKMPDLPAYFSINRMTLNILNNGFEDVVLREAGSVELEQGDQYVLVPDEEHAQELIKAMIRHLSLISKSEPVTAENICDLLFY